MFKDHYKEAFKDISPSNELVQKVIENTSRKGKETRKNIMKSITISAAAIVLIFIASINISPAFANSLDEIPVLGSITKVLSFRNYSEDATDYNILVNHPMVDGAIETNQIITETIEEYKVSAEQSIAEYKDAYISTGGTEEGFIAKDIKVVIDYEVKADNENYISFVLEMYESWTASSAVYKYYNLDSKTGEKLTLADFLGDHYIEVANSSIRKQMEETDFEVSSSGFETITDDTAFYINESGNPVIVFEKYEIASGAVGRPEFEITKTNINGSNQPENYSVEQQIYESEDAQILVRYPELQNYKGALLQDYINQSIFQFVDIFKQGGSYQLAQIEYTIERSDDNYLSILFVGTAELSGYEKEVNIFKTLTFDLATSNEITFENFVTDPIALKTILEEIDGKTLEYEGMSVYFNQEGAVFYYMPLDDSAGYFSQIAVPFEKIQSVVTFDFGEKPAS